MNLVKFFKDMESLQDQLSNLVTREYRRTPRMAFLPGESLTDYPYMNIAENAENVYVEALAPGVEPDSLKINVLRNTLTITGEKTRSKIPLEDHHRCERAPGKFVRSIELPLEINSERVSAEYKNGLLFITLPKAEAAKPRQIEVKVN